MRGRLLPTLLAAAAVAAAAGCTAVPPAERPVVVVSVAPQAWLVQRLAGDAVDVRVLIPSGASPATFEPTVRQMKQVAAAVAYVKVGHPAFPFEGAWLDRLLHENRGLAVIDTWDGILGDDPHTWVSPKAFVVAAERVALGLAPLLPGRRESIDAALVELRAELHALDDSIRQRLAGMRGRRFFVFHAAWGRFAADYGLEQIAIEHGSIEPSPHELARLVDLARRERASVVFVQPQFSRAHATQLARQIGARLEFADPLAPDWPANLERFADALAAALADADSTQGEKTSRTVTVSRTGTPSRVAGS